ncbi:oxidoreductase [Agrilutibacter solisilvae]|uniref:Oxidoreductase n=1 Tax=Agrilutibacter solisilvae TaxID=2763317 RepID=A0A974XZV0_9GAMM|nr:oxidoreductase [Lysobacter solisilvae]QSX77865.1 oxidoreductase [Lysobacter solisilvae]
MPPRPAPTRVALIGYGFAGRTFHAPLIQAVPALSLVVVASRDAARVHADLPQVDVIADPLAAIADPRVQLVVIASPNQSHAPLARAALAAGRHVVVDKPVTPTLAEACELATLARHQDRVLSVFHNRRWDSDFLAVREAIASGLIGEPVHLESRIERFRPDVRARWREQAGPASGLWWDLGPHLVDQALLLLGRPDSVLASLSAQRGGAVTDDWAHVLLAYGSRRVVLHAGMLAAGAGARFVVHGTRGSLVKQGADRQEAQLMAGLRPGDPRWGEDPDPLVWHDAEGGVHRRPVPRGDQSRFYAGLAAAVRGEGENPVSPVQMLDVMAVMEAAVDAAASGCARVPAWVDPR